MSKVKDHDLYMREIFDHKDGLQQELLDELKRLEFENEQQRKYIEHLERLLKANALPL